MPNSTEEMNGLFLYLLRNAANIGDQARTFCRGTVGSGEHRSHIGICQVPIGGTP